MMILQYTLDHFNVPEVCCFFCANSRVSSSIQFTSFERYSQQRQREADRAILIWKVSGIEICPNPDQSCKLCHKN